MRFIQTLYIKEDVLKNSFAWAAPEYHLMSWALSSLQLHKIYSKVELYANSNAARILIDILKLPYSKIHITHDALILPHRNLWALPKIHTYSLQDEPFLHIDGDVFLFDKLTEKLLGGLLMAQNFEEATDYYLQSQKQLIEHFTYFPKCVQLDFDSGIPIEAVNAGILGGNNMDFMKKYTRLASQYVNENISHLSHINVDRFNVFYEQHLFCSLAKEKGIAIEVLFPATMRDNQYVYLGNVHEVPCKKSYLHLLGQYKRDVFTCRLMAAKLRQLYPEYYYRIIAIFKNNRIPLSTILYLNKNIKTIKDYTNFAASAIESYYHSSKNKSEMLTKSVAVEKKEIVTLSILENFIKELKECNDYNISDIENDFKVFSKNIRKLLRQKRFNAEYIYGRDLESVSWYCELFGNEFDITDKAISKCEEVYIITSVFNWAGLWNKLTRVGVKYYEELVLIPDVFHNMIVMEIYGDGFSLQDMDEMEKMILDNLITPLSIRNLFESMLEYVEEGVIKKHLEEYKKLIIVMLKQLVLKKAIKPLLRSKSEN